jgi:hypothetical protein
MSRRAAFNQSDVTRAFKGALAAGVKVAVLIRPDGTMEIVPAAGDRPMIADNDLDARLDAFGGR